MRHVDDFSDRRHKAWCIYCGDPIANVAASRDHVPTKALLSKPLRERGARYDAGIADPDGYLPQVLVCVSCNVGFADDENYLLCVLHAVQTGSLYPNPQEFPEAASVLRSNRHVVRSLKSMPNGQPLPLNNAKPFTVYPDIDRIKRVAVKNARGHAYHELGEPMLEDPQGVSIIALTTLSEAQLAQFESFGNGHSLWPEVGSRMMLRLTNGHGLAGGWIEVERGRYRYAMDWSDGVTVRTVIWNYLATEVRWEN